VNPISTSARGAGAQIGGDAVPVLRPAAAPASWRRAALPGRSSVAGERAVAAGEHRLDEHAPMRPEAPATAASHAGDSVMRFFERPDIARRAGGLGGPVAALRPSAPHQRLRSSSLSSIFGVAPPSWCS